MLSKAKAVSDCALAEKHMAKSLGSDDIYTWKEEELSVRLVRNVRTDQEPTKAALNFTSHRGALR